MPVIRLETRIAAPPAACFALSLSVDAHTASMRASGERAVAGVIRGEMGQGDVVTWRATHFGVPWRMTSRITEHEAPHRFVDEQISGPFARWWHEHRFEQAGAGTLMLDLVEFASPCGPFGRLVDRLVLRRYLTGLLSRRNRWLAGELEPNPTGRA
ncbi:SRPBCC family protein [Leucobacter triazinivorans]|uniref:Cyclase n=1 Tax=Leucobacter triazinivorans TaxID=1784719 RepID=A0A4P6KBW9_9MICO|nr:SRPBCC family protein [Leucobacter triazinivorans]QBE47795.1 cyclase [Leucobacter triazinivorans]